MQQQQPVQQRVITLAQAAGGRHVLQDGSLWTRPIGRPRVHPAPRKHSEARCNQWKHHRIKKNADAALQAAQTVLALYSEATEREMLAQSERARQDIHSRATSLQQEASSREEELVALQAQVGKSVQAAFAQGEQSAYASGAAAGSVAFAKAQAAAWQERAGM